ncbi:LOW QUALITY PROTEIN: hypothetical protein MAR_008471 [Mya arenaria]|uniref:Uncharacterized protein n=1 Tax=Mya arenaria TaxID=6604 RepID=A0ABY7DZ82_MYAAR|nr:LOW QUALITY PROTEIN: hypothetical protein MAR_008471 [Mya arenaria]
MFNRKAKPYWTEEVKAAHAQARRARHIWLADPAVQCQTHSQTKNKPNALSGEYSGIVANPKKINYMTNLIEQQKR